MNYEMPMKRLVFILPLLLFCIAGQAQIQFGYVSYEQVLKEMPEYAKATQDLAALKAKYEAEACSPTRVGLHGEH